MTFPHYDVDNFFVPFLTRDVKAVVPFKIANFSEPLEVILYFYNHSPLVFFDSQIVDKLIPEK